VKKITCLIVEDEPLARNLMTDYVQRVPYLHLVEACPNAMRALEVLKTTPAELLFLDIQMPEITGITLLKILPVKPLVIFTTAYSQYALEGYELDVVDYLLKPVTFDRFLKAVEKANQRLTSLAPAVADQKVSFVFVKDGTKMVKVNLDDLLYIEGLKDYVTLHTRQQKIVTLQRMKHLEEQLPADTFIRVHHSFIVNTSAISAVHRNEIQIGQHLIPVSDSYKKAVKEFVERNQME
jgi:DNA-binding LytR/AlgR family response regulator